MAKKYFKVILDEGTTTRTKIKGDEYDALIPQIATAEEATILVLCMSDRMSLTIPIGKIEDKEDAEEAAEAIYEAVSDKVEDLDETDGKPVDSKLDKNNGVVHIFIGNDGDDHSTEVAKLITETISFKPKTKAKDDGSKKKSKADDNGKKKAKTDDGKKKAKAKSDDDSKKAKKKLSTMEKWEALEACGGGDSANAKKLLNNGLYKAAARKGAFTMGIMITKIDEAYEEVFGDK